MNRPACFEFAMDFLGDPEEKEVRAYVEKLEATARGRTLPASGQTMTLALPSGNAVSFLVGDPGSPAWEELRELVAERRR
jgi:hypothetical protein